MRIDESYKLFRIEYSDWLSRIITLWNKTVLIKYNQYSTI